MPGGWSPYLYEAPASRDAARHPAAAAARPQGEIPTLVVAEPIIDGAQTHVVEFIEAIRSALVDFR